MRDLRFGGSTLAAGRQGLDFNDMDIQVLRSEHETSLYNKDDYLKMN
jgi:hypothetical protein